MEVDVDGNVSQHVRELSLKLNVMSVNEVASSAADM